MLRQDLDQLVRDLGTMTQMQIVQVFSNGFDRTRAPIRDLVTFRQSQVTESRGCGQDPEQSLVRQVHTRGQV